MIREITNTRFALVARYSMLGGIASSADSCTGTGYAVIYLVGAEKTLGVLNVRIFEAGRAFIRLEVALTAIGRAFLAVVLI